MANWKFDNMSTIMEIDDVYKIIGEFGIYHVFLYLCIIPSYITLAFQLLQNVFIAAVPDFYCENNVTVYNQCPTEGSCQSYVYNGSDFTSVVSEVGGNHYFVSKIQHWQFYHTL